MGIDNVIREIIQKKFPPPPSEVLDKGLGAPQANSKRGVGATEYTEHPTPADASYYPGTLNRDENGNKIVTDFSDLNQIKNSLAYHQEKNGGGMPKIEYPMADKGFTKEVFDHGTSSNGTPQVNYELLKRLNPYLQDSNFKIEDIIKVNLPDKRALMLDLAPLTVVGDPRWSTGAVYQSMYQEFLPKIDAWTAVLAVGGVQIKDVYICNPNGDPIKQASPDIIKNYREKPPTVSEMRDFFDKSHTAALRKHADAFVKFLKKYYLNPTYNPYLEMDEQWEATVYSFDEPKIMLIGLKFDQKGRTWHWDDLGGFTTEEVNAIDITINGPAIPDIEDPNNDDNTGVRKLKARPKGHWETYVYKTFYAGRKYYYDQKDYVSGQLQTPLVPLEGWTPPGIPDIPGAIVILNTNIPDYVRLVN